MEVACGEHGDYVQKLVVAVNAGRCTTVLSKALEATGQKIISNDIAKETTHMKPNGVTLPNEPSGLTPPTCTTSLLGNIPIDLKQQIEVPNEFVNKFADSSENLTQDKHGFPTSGFHQFLVLFMRSVCIIFR